MKFKMGQKVAAVNRSSFFEDIKMGTYVLCDIYEIIPYSSGTNIMYRAKSENGNIFAGFENNLSMSPTELIDLDYLLELLDRFKKEALSDAGYLNRKISEVRDICNIDGKDDNLFI